MTANLRRKNKFCFFIPEEQNFYIVYNSINGLCLRLSDSIISDDSFDFSKLADNQKRYLIDNSFLESETELSSYAQEDSKVLYITIELSTSCNLSCTYCYQSHWDQRPRISLQTIDDLIKVISNSSLSSFSLIDVNLIGGEPSLFEDECLYVYKSFRQLCRNKQLELHFKFNTNGLLLSRSFIDSIFNTDIVWSIMTPSDYSRGLVTRKNKLTISFEDYLRVIDELSDSLNENSTINVVFRLNIHHGNKHNLGSYLNQLKAVPLIRKSFQIARMENHPNNYINKLSVEDYKDWLINEAIPSFIREGLSIPIQPRHSLFKCKAVVPYSCKLYSDGRIGICNGYSYNSTYPFIDKISNLEEINLILSEYKIDGLERCLSCPYIYLCEGRVRCNDYKCNYDHDFTEKLILKIAQINKSSRLK